MQEALTQMTEGLAVRGMKDTILAASFKYHIRRQPGMRTNFPNSLLKSMISVKETSNKTRV